MLYITFLVFIYPKTGILFLLMAYIQLPLSWPLSFYFFKIFSVKYIHSISFAKSCSVFLFCFFIHIVSLYTYTYISICIYQHVMCIYVYVFMCMYIYRYIHTHISPLLIISLRNINSMWLREGRRHALAFASPGDFRAWIEGYISENGLKPQMCHPSFVISPPGDLATETKQEWRRRGEGGSGILRRPLQRGDSNQWNRTAGNDHSK